MIHPTFQVTEELYIHAARAAVWARFCRVTEWSRWRDDVSKASWGHGQSWQEGAQFTIVPATQNIGQLQTFTIRMAVPDDTTVWENSSGQGVVYTLHLTDQVGGCKVTLRCTFHGWGSLLKRLRAINEKAHLRILLTALKAAIERPETRR